MNRKMTTNSQLSSTELKNKNKLSKQLEHRRESQKWRLTYQWGGGGWRMGEKVQGLRSMIGKYKIGREMLRKEEEIEKPKILYA